MCKSDLSMNEDFCDRWSVYLDGGGEPEWREGFETHLHQCPVCQQQLAETAEWDTALRDYVARSTPNFSWTSSISVRVPTATDWQLKRHRIVVTVSIALAAGLLMGALLWQLIQLEKPLPVAKNVVEPEKAMIDSHAPTEGNAQADARQSTAPEDLPPAIIRKVQVANHLVVTQQISDEFTFVMLYPTISTDDQKEVFTYPNEEVR